MVQAETWPISFFFVHDNYRDYRSTIIEDREEHYYVGQVMIHSFFAESSIISSKNG